MIISPSAGLVLICPSPFKSTLVSIFPLPLRSMQPEASLAILVTEPWRPTARFATQTSPFKSSAVRDGLLGTLRVMFGLARPWLHGGPFKVPGADQQSFGNTDQ